MSFRDNTQPKIAIDEWSEPVRRFSLERLRMLLACALSGFTVIIARADVFSDASLQPWFAVWTAVMFAGGWVCTAGRGARAERQPAEKPTSIPILLFSIVLIAGALRAWQLDFGFPFFNHPDEGTKGEIVARMIQNSSLNPHYFLHPTLLLYLSRILSPILGALGLQEDPILQAVLAGRIVSCIAGTTSVFLLYFVGRRLLSAEAGLIGAAILAVSPLHVTCSRYMKEDALCVSFMLACLLAALKGAQDKKAHWLLASGLLAGLSASSKYTGVLAAGFPLAVPFFFRRERLPYPAIALSFALVPIGFLLGCPYALLNSGAFVKHFLVERNHMKGGHHGIAITAASQWWTYHVSRSILPGIHIVPTALALLGLGAALRLNRTAGFLLLGCVLVFYLPAEWVKAKPPPQPERYILGSLPFLALAAGYLITAMGGSGRSAFAALLCFAGICFPAFRTLELARDLPFDTRQQMRSWMLQNLPPTSKILVEASYSPRFRDTSFDIKLSKALKHPNRFTRQRLRETGYEYLLVNSFSYDRHFKEPRVNRLLRNRFEGIFASFELVKEIRAESGPYGFHNPVMRLYRIPQQEE